MDAPKILKGSPGDAVVLLGNEAIARGFAEGGIRVAASYPGTPASEIMQALIDAGRELGIYTEWSVNEKVAAEVAIAASMSGLRSMVSMKGVGINVASEPLQAFTYMGAKGGMVVVSADDAAMYSSHTEQDNRLFAREAYIPVLEPSGPAEARDMARTGLELSEHWHQPVMLRITTGIAHTSADITLGRLERPPAAGAFERAPERWVNLPANARRMRKELIGRMGTLTGEVGKLPFNRFEGSEDSKKGIIACGVTYGAVKEALRLIGLEDEIRILKLGTPYPMPEKMVEELLSGTKEVLVVEEVEPFVEQQVAAIANKSGIRTLVKGKEHVALSGDVRIDDLVRGLCAFTGAKVPKHLSSASKLAEEAGALLLPRPPVLCPGCGHRAVFYAMNLVERRLKRKVIKPSDIGCYTLGYQDPLNAVDAHLCMGASIGLSCGFSKVVDDPVICTIGDSTFFHAGMPPLMNAVFNKANIAVVILDNGTTAMTGHQPHPGVGRTAAGESTSKVMIEDVARALGVGYVRVVDTEDLKGLVEAIEGAVRFEGVGVVVARGPCAILDARRKRKGGEEIVPYRVDETLCKGCRLCINKFGCPALCTDEKGIVWIDQILCAGCAVCTDVLVCPKGAIKKGRKGGAGR